MIIQKPYLPIGVFDSGLGGLTILSSIHQLLPQESTIYIADNNHAPYGLKTASEIAHLASVIISYFIAKPVKLIVIACNTVTAAAIDQLRQDYPQIPIVGTEPAIKPAIIHSQTGKIGVLATRYTLSSHKYLRLKSLLAKQIEIYEDPCSGLVEQIELGSPEPATTTILHRVLDPMLEAGIDQLVLGCTHYPLLTDQIQRIVGNSITLINPNLAITSRVKSLLIKNNLLHHGKRTHEYLVTKYSPSYQKLFRRVISPNYEITH